MATYRAHLPEGGFVMFDAPDNASDDELQAAGQMRVAQHQRNLQKEIAKGREEYDPTADMSGTDKVLANIGAGMSNLGTGVRSLGTKLFGSDADKKAMDAEVVEKRALDEELANKTSGGAFLQLAGEIAPTLLIPAGGLAGGAARLAGRALPRALGAQVAGRLAGSTVADASLAGGLSGALSPTTSDESTLGRVAAGAVLGGAVPYLGAKVAETAARLNPFGSGEKAAAKVIGEQLAAAGGDATAKAQALAQAIRELPSMQADVASSGARRAAQAADMGAGAFDDPALAAAQRAGKTLAGAKPAAGVAEEAAAGGARPGGIALSTAAQLQSPELAWLEIGSRARNAANWSKADQDYAEGLSKALRSATAEGGDIENRLTTKNANWNANMQEALAAADPQKFAGHVEGLKANIAQAMRSPEAVNPKVRNLLQTMQSEIETAGEDFSPAHMQQMRANFNEDVSPFNPTAYGAAPRENKAVKSVIQELDNILDDTTGGAWQKTRSDYTRDVQSLDQAKAAQRLYEKFYDEGGRARGTGQGITGDLPSITEAGFGRAVGGRDEGLYSQAAQSQIDAIQDAIRAKNIVQRVKTSGTGGGGSATAPTWYAAQDVGTFGKAVADAVRGLPGGGALMSATEGLGKLANVNREKAIANALQDPSKMLALLERVEASGQPLTRTQRALLQTLRDTSAGMATAAQPR